MLKDDSRLGVLPASEVSAGSRSASGPLAAPPRKVSGTDQALTCAYAAALAACGCRGDEIHASSSARASSRTGLGEEGAQAVVRRVRGVVEEALSARSRDARSPDVAADVARAARAALAHAYRAAGRGALAGRGPDAAGLREECAEQRRRLAAREAEAAELRAELQAMRAQAAPAAPPQERLRSALQAEGRRLRECESLQAERQHGAAGQAERAQRQLLALEARTLALGRELESWPAQGSEPSGSTKLPAEPAGAPLSAREACASPAREVAAAAAAGCHAATPSGGGLALQPPAMLSPKGSVGQRRAPTSPAERRRLAGLAQSSAAAVAALLRQVRSLDDARELLAGRPTGLDGKSAGSAQAMAMDALEQQTGQLEHMNRLWVLSMAGASWAGGEELSPQAGDVRDVIPGGSGSSDSAANIAFQAWREARLHPGAPAQLL